MLNYQRVLGKHPEVKSQCQYQLLDVELGAKWMAKRYEDVTIEQYDLRNVWSRSVWRSVFVLRALRMHGASKTGMQHDATRFCMHPCLYQMVFFGSAKLIKTRTLSQAVVHVVLCEVYVHTHAFDCEKGYNDWHHLWSSAHQRYCCWAPLRFESKPDPQQEDLCLAPLLWEKKWGQQSALYSHQNRKFDTQITLW